MCISNKVQVTLFKVFSQNCFPFICMHYKEKCQCHLKSKFIKEDNAFLSLSGYRYNWKTLKEIKIILTEPVNCKNIFAATCGHRP